MIDTDAAMMTVGEVCIVIMNVTVHPPYDHQTQQQQQQRPAI